MSVNNPQSLPSFAQAFSTPHLNSFSNALPPIKKRTRTDDDQPEDTESVPVKHEIPDDSPPPSAKKRRVTISGAPHPLNTDVRLPSDQTNATPISPVVIGLPMPDDPTSIEQVRSTISIQHQQKALIEQRRGSVAGILSPAPSGAPGEERTAPKPPPASRPLRRSPSNNASLRRTTTRSDSPGPSPVPHHTLPPPPISFARRRATQLGGSKKKPADIVISPREAHTKDSFQPSIQSAPPVPQGQGMYSSVLGAAAAAGPSVGRFPMTLPRLPPVLGSASGEGGRRVGSGIVPPTPTRLAMQRHGGGAAAANTSANTTGGPIVQPISNTNRSPPAASVPIASTLVPPTPSTLHHPSYSADKSGFLQPFEMFYDALNDSKQLKGWLGEQLTRAGALMERLQGMEGRIGEMVAVQVEKKVAGMRAEMGALQRRVEELEEALKERERRPAKGKQPLRNGLASTDPDTYAFPAMGAGGVESPPALRHGVKRTERGRASPGWGVHEKETHEAERGSPAPFDARRLSTSATRLDPPRVQQQGGGESTSNSSSGTAAARLAAVHSPPQAFRERERGASPLGNHGKSGKAERPGLVRQHSSSGSGRSAGEREREGSPKRGGPAEGRKNSVAVTPQETTMEEG